MQEPRIPLQRQNYHRQCILKGIPGEIGEQRFGEEVGTATPSSTGVISQIRRAEPKMDNGAEFPSTSCHDFQWS